MSTDEEAKKKATPDEEAKKKATPDEEAKKKGTTDEEAKKKARLARFAPASKTDTLEEEKRKARMIRYDHCKLLSFISIYRSFTCFWQSIVEELLCICT